MRPKSIRALGLLVIIVSFLVTTASFASPVRQREDDAHTAASLLAARSITPPSLFWNRDRGTPEAIFGAFWQRFDGVASESSARAFIADNAALFAARRDTSDLRFTRTLQSPAGDHFVFQQEAGGVPVYGATLEVHYNRSGEVIAINNSYVPDLGPIATDPAIAIADAIAIAAGGRIPRAALSKRGPVRGDELRTNLGRASGELVIDARGDRENVLAWRIVVPTSRETWEIFVDATSGEIRGEPRDLNQYATGSGTVFNVSAVVATHNNSLRDNNDSASAVPASAYSTVSLVNLSGNGYLEGTFASSSRTKRRAFNASNTFNFDRSSVGFSETMGYYYLDYAQRYIQSLGFTNVNNRRQVFSANGTSKDNSWYSPNNKELTFGTGGVDDAEDAEVVLHEYGHSIQDNQKPGFGSSLESGSMGEGFGDYWAGSVGGQLSGGFQDTCIMEWDATSYSSTNPPCLRRLDTTKHYPESVAGQVHADGEIWSAALWQIRGSLGAAKADKVILQHHFLVSTGATFNQASNALVTAAINLGYSAAEVESIRSILRARGFTVSN